MDGTGNRPFKGLLGLALMLGVGSGLACNAPSRIFRNLTGVSTLEAIATELPPIDLPTLPSSLEELEEMELPDLSALETLIPNSAGNIPEDIKEVYFQGIGFSYPVELAEEVVGQRVSAETGADAFSTPEHVRFDFNQYILQDRFQDPVLYVFLTEAYRSVNPVAGDVIADLEQVLLEQPENPEELPFLPVFNAAQLMVAKVQYLEFQTGSGVRYLTQYAQDTAAINNEDLFYTFQGLSSDGMYILSLILPVSNELLPPDASEIPGGELFDFSEYLGSTEEMINLQPGATFRPQLSYLDFISVSLITP